MVWFGQVSLSVYLSSQIRIRRIGSNAFTQKVRRDLTRNFSKYLGGQGLRIVFEFVEWDELDYIPRLIFLIYS